MTLLSVWHGVIMRKWGPGHRQVIGSPSLSTQDHQTETQNNFRWGHRVICGCNESIFVSLCLFCVYPWSWWICPWWFVSLNHYVSFSWYLYLWGHFVCIFGHFLSACGQFVFLLSSVTTEAQLNCWYCTDVFKCVSWCISLFCLVLVCFWH